LNYPAVEFGCAALCRAITTVHGMESWDTPDYDECRKHNVEGMTNENITMTKE
jgi:hypothetical protein